MRRGVVGPVLGRLAADASVILDVGGNDGSVSTGQCGRAVRRIVVDLDRAGLAGARAGGAAVMVASALAIPLPRGSVDVALCCDVLPCLAPDQAPLVYAEIAGVLKPGGHLVMTEVDEAYGLPFVDNDAVFARWEAVTGGSSYERLAGLLDAAGLSVVEHRMFYGAISRFAYTLFFVWVRPRRGYRVKQRAWRLIADLDRMWSPAPRAHLVVARAV